MDNWGLRSSMITRITGAENGIRIDLRTAHHDQLKGFRFRPDNYPETLRQLCFVDANAAYSWRQWAPLLIPRSETLPSLPQWTSFVPLGAAESDYRPFPCFFLCEGEPTKEEPDLTF
jgi:hypothetical protein